MIRLSSGLGWCGNSAFRGPDVAANPDLGNYVIIDLQAPTIIRGFRLVTSIRDNQRNYVKER